MIAPTCDKCGQELGEFGALAFSPPEADGNVRKFHICRRCFELLLAWLGKDK